MTGIALIVYVAFGVVAFGGRTWLQYRRTGDCGLRGLSGETGSIEWLGGVSLAAGMALAAAGPAAELSGLLRPWRVLSLAGVRGAGLALELLGVAVTIVAQLQMRDSWRIGVRASEATPLVRAGLFSMVRNPIYLGMLLVTAGLFGLAPNLLSMAAFATALLGAEIQVRRVEEPYLMRVHGAPYLAYGRAAGRFLPWIGRLPPR